MASLEAMHPTPEDRIKAALWFAEHGFGVFSCWSAAPDGSCRCPKGKDCTSQGKHPITANGFQDATRDPDRIRKVLSAGSEPNYGLVCPEGVFAWDLDGEGWQWRLAQLEMAHGALPATLRTDTANGQHIFLRWPEGHPRPLHRMFGWVTRWGTGRQAGYVIGPRSVHYTGTEYTPSGVFEIATLPEAWAVAALADEQDDSIKVGGDVSMVQVGQRHDWLRDRARFYAGVIRDPQVLRATMLAENEKLTSPKTPDEVDRAIGEVLTRFPADELEQDPDTGETRRVRGDGEDMLGDDVTFPFPDPPRREAYGGLVGEMVGAILDETDASEVALLASLLSLCGVLVPSRAYFGRRQVSAVHVALVGESSIGRKGTAMNRARDMLANALGTYPVNRAVLAGVNSGEGLVTKLENLQTTFKHDPTAAVVFEEEYATFLSAAGREGSSLDSRMRLAFDGSALANHKQAGSQSVEEPYWLSALVGITPSELQEKGPAGALRSGSANRWVWLPVERREVDVVNVEPLLPDDLLQALLEARGQSPRDLSHTPEASRILTDYGKHLVKDAAGLSRDLSRRYPIIAFRIGMIHAALDRSAAVTAEHVGRGIALTEYARRGTPWVFGYTVGNELATNILRHLREVGSLTRSQITRDWARDPIKRQRALDELRRLGFARIVKTGRQKAELQLVTERQDFRDFHECLTATTST